MDQRCLACHREVGQMRTAGRGLHARVRDKTCASCHPDHGGRDFQLIAWDGGRPDAFDHARAGYTLSGSHASLECRACHKPILQRSGVVPLIKVKDHARSWLGLETACASCHDDPHRGELGTECARCHGESKWTPAPKFDHAKTEYPLTGKHEAVRCVSCHEAVSLQLGRDAEGEVIPRWKPLPHGECSSCHSDPHRGGFGAKCASCHSTVGFHAIREEGFDHDRTRYPLRGSHATLACATCHDPVKAWGRKPPFERCDGCHRDAHAGQATIRGAASDCASCHAVAGFHPSIFPLAAHEQTGYPLRGAHLRAACEQCHSKGDAAQATKLGPSRVLMRPAHAACADCHRDPHQGQLGASTRGTGSEACLQCHDLERFHPSRFDVAAHAASRFPLQGAHRAVPCEACHAELRRTPAASTLRGSTASRALRFDEKAETCADCHSDPHGGQFAERRKGAACDDCHGIEGFVPAERFDHDRDARFKLQGAHARTACASCHTPQRGRDGVVRTLYRQTPSRCESCHADGTTKGDSGASGRVLRDPLMLFTSREASHASLH
jgi:hypothetical protein